jgi:methionine salvage enolase-phosphatase E1
MWTELIKFIGGAAVLLAVVAWLIRSLIRYLLTKDIEKYKFDLKREADKELEAIKASLNIEALTHQIRFSKLHDRRADVIEKLYTKIVALETASGCLEAEFQMDDYDELKQKADLLIDRYFDVHSFIEGNKIYFSENLSDNIKKFNALYFNLSIGIYYQSKPGNIEEFIKAFKKEREKFHSQNKKIKAVIESDFRKLLGVIG